MPTRPIPNRLRSGVDARLDVDPTDNNRYQSDQLINRADALTTAASWWASSSFQPANPFLRSASTINTSASSIPAWEIVQTWDQAWDPASPLRTSLITGLMVVFVPGRARQLSVRPPTNTPRYTNG